jgi:hypothetical protein
LSSKNKLAKLNAISGTIALLLKRHGGCTVVEKSEQIVVDTTLPLVRQKEVIQQLTEYEGENLRCYKIAKVDKKVFNCPLICGAEGVGKAQVVMEFNNQIKSRLQAKGMGNSLTGSIYLNFSWSDMLTKEESTILGLRFASHFFFGKSALWLHSQISLLGRVHHFDFGGVLELISEYYDCQKQPLVLTVQIDEFDQIPALQLTQMLWNIGYQMVYEQSRKVWLLPCMTGTTAAFGVSAVATSALIPRPILLPPLSPDHSMTTGEQH